MEHRHIETDDRELTVAAAESILERGSDRDIREMMTRLRDDPFSRSSDNALVAAENCDVYGYSAMVRECLAHWRGSHGVRR